jgi:hypothetical protein
MARRNAKEKTDQVVLVQHRGRAQMRTGKSNDWTQEMADSFCEVLADTCNVRLATAAIGRSVSGVYKQRSKDASFRASWDAALAIGYSRLELMLLERALHGVEKQVTHRDGTTTVMREYPDRIALTLLRMHRENAALADQTVDETEFEEARERIMARLERLRERESGDGVEHTEARSVPQ